MTNTEEKVERQWGYYRVLHEVPGCKVKELTVNPGKKLSKQRHKLRNEFWLVSEGNPTVYYETDTVKDVMNMVEHEQIAIPAMAWHQLCNFTSKPVRIVEIQYGENCIEEDIERVTEKVAELA